MSGSTDLGAMLESLLDVVACWAEPTGFGEPPSQAAEDANREGHRPVGVALDPRDVVAGAAAVESEASGPAVLPTPVAWSGPLPRPRRPRRDPTVSGHASSRASPLAGGGLSGSARGSGELGGPMGLPPRMATRPVERGPVARRPAPEPDPVAGSSVVAGDEGSRVGAWFSATPSGGSNGAGPSGARAPAFPRPAQAWGADGPVGEGDRPATNGATYARAGRSEMAAVQGDARPPGPVATPTTADLEDAIADLLERALFESGIEP